MSYPFSGKKGSSVQSLRGSFSPWYELVTQLWQDAGPDDLAKRSNQERRDANDPSALVGPGSRDDTEPLSQSHYQMLYLSQLEVARLYFGVERTSLGVVRCTTPSYEGVVTAEFHRYSWFCHRRHRRRGQDSHPVRSPRFRSSASVPAQTTAFATGVPPDICAFHRYTRNSVVPYRTLAMTVSSGVSRLSLEVSHPTDQAAYELFTPNESGQRSPPTYHRGCWHVVGRGFFCGYRQFRSH